MNHKNNSLAVDNIAIAVIGSGYWGKNLVRNFYDLGLRQTASVDSILTGGRYDYRLAVVNQGPCDALDVTIASALPQRIDPTGFNFQPDVQTEG